RSLWTRHNCRSALAITRQSGHYALVLVEPRLGPLRVGGLRFLREFDLQYAIHDDVSIAYAVFGAGPRDILLSRTSAPLTSWGATAACFVSRRARQLCLEEVSFDFGYGSGGCDNSRRPRV